MAHSRIQIDAYAATKLGALALAEAIRLAIAGKRQLMGTTQVVEHGEGDYDRGNNRATKGSGRLEHWISRDYMVTYPEATS